MSCGRKGCQTGPGNPEEVAEDLCRCPGGMSEKFLQPCLLLLLHKEPSYGYSLLEELSKLGITTDASVIYRNLRKMEGDGLVKSHWDTRGPGPAKRNYTITPDGEDLLHSWIATIEKNRRILEDFLKAYQERFKEKK